MSAMGGMTDQQLAAGWYAADDRGDFDKADEYEYEFFRRRWSQDNFDHDDALELWKRLIDANRAKP